MNICSLCEDYLIKYHTFRNQCLKSHSLLLEIKESEAKVERESDYDSEDDTPLHTLVSTIP